uniref:Uncharacterized protein n=1 Tax=Salix viminalis TaxID=40686 RepID=A0A6N2ND91_SALVM
MVAGNGKARNKIRFEKLEAVIRTPLKNRKDILCSKYPFLFQWLSFELPQRIIREEGFFKSALELLYGAPMGWRGNLVHLHRSFF